MALKKRNDTEKLFEWNMYRVEQLKVKKLQLKNLQLELDTLSHWIKTLEDEIKELNKTSFFKSNSLKLNVLDSSKFKIIGK